MKLHVAVASVIICDSRAWIIDETTCCSRIRDHLWFSSLNHRWNYMLQSHPWSSVILEPESSMKLHVAVASVIICDSRAWIIDETTCCSRIRDHLWFSSLNHRWNYMLQSHPWSSVILEPESSMKLHVAVASVIICDSRAWIIDETTCCSRIRDHLWFSSLNHRWKSIFEYNAWKYVKKRQDHTLSSISS